MARPLRVLSWNLWWRFDDWEARLRAIAAVLERAQPDVCGLQEVWDGDGANAAAHLAERLGMHWTWSPSPRPERWQRRLGRAGVGIGNAILSRWPIVDPIPLTLPAGDAEDEGRTVLHARIAAPGGHVPFFTTQLNSAPAHSDVRCLQVGALARFVAGNALPDGHPPVVTGDFNAEPDSDEMRLLGGHKTAPAVPGLVLVDAWRYAEPPSFGPTWDRRNPHVAATGEPSARIDYVLVGLPDARGSGAVRGAGLVGDGPVDGVWPSDHAGVRADLAVARDDPEEP